MILPQSISDANDCKGKEWKTSPLLARYGLGEDGLQKAGITGPGAPGLDCETWETLSLILIASALLLPVAWAWGW